MEVHYDEAHEDDEHALLDTSLSRVDGWVHEEKSHYYMH